MPQTNYLPLYTATYSNLAKVQKPGGITVLSAVGPGDVPNKPTYSSAGTGVAYALPGAVARINMLVSPKNAFGTASWAKTAIQDTTFATKTAAPDGTLTASKMIENSAASAYHYIIQPIQRVPNATVSAGIKYRVMVDAKAAERTRLRVQPGDIAGSNGVFVTFDLAAGSVAIAPVTFGTGWVAGAAAVSPIGNGFYRCMLDFTTTGIISFQPQILLDNGSGTAASSVQYTGNGTNGLYLWQVSILPTAVWSIGRQTFFDDFTSLSTIDVSNSKGPGFNWYTNGAWPNAAPDSAGNSWRTNSVLPAANLSVAGSVLTISNCANNSTSFGADLMTAVTDGASGYIGMAFSLPALFEASFAFDTSLSNGNAVRCPSFWGISVEYLIGAQTEFVENDHYIAVGNAVGSVSQTTTLYDWTTPATTNISNSNANFVSGTTWPVSTANSINQNVYQDLVLNAASNGGVGMKQTYVNGTFVQQSEVCWSATGGATPGATPSNPAGVFSVGDAQHYPVVFGTGQSWPLNIDFAAVWQP